MMTERESLRHGDHHVVSTLQAVVSGLELVMRPVCVVLEHHEGTCQFPSNTYNSNLGALGEILKCEIMADRVNAYLCAECGMEANAYTGVRNGPGPLDYDREPIHPVQHTFVPRSGVQPPRTRYEMTGVESA